MTYLHAKVQYQPSVGSEDSKSGNKWTDGQTDGQMNRGDCISSLANAVGSDVKEEMPCYHWPPSVARLSPKPRTWSTGEMHPRLSHADNPATHPSHPGTDHQSVNPVPH